MAIADNQPQGNPMTCDPCMVNGLGCDLSWDTKNCPPNLPWGNSCTSCKNRGVLCDNFGALDHGNAFRRSEDEPMISQPPYPSTLRGLSPSPGPTAARHPQGPRRGQAVPRQVVGRKRKFAETSSAESSAAKRPSPATASLRSTTPLTNTPPTTSTSTSANTSTPTSSSPSLPLEDLDLPGDWTICALPDCDGTATHHLDGADYCTYHHSRLSNGDWGYGDDFIEGRVLTGDLNDGTYIHPIHDDDHVHHHIPHHAVVLAHPWYGIENARQGWRDCEECVKWGHSLAWEYRC